MYYLKFNKKYFGILLFTISFLFQAAFGQTHSMRFSGDAEQHQGLAFWNADGNGYENAAYGHTTSCSEGAQPYYLATADYSNIDSLAESGLTADSIFIGFPTFSALLAQKGYFVSDLTMIWGIYSLGEDIYGNDWWASPSCVETRIYHGNQDIIIQLNGQDMVGGRAPDLIFEFDWDERDIALNDAVFEIEDYSQRSSSDVEALSVAFREDLAGKQVRLYRHEQREPVQIPIQSGHGREGFFQSFTGLFLEALDAVGIQNVSNPVGIHSNAVESSPQEFRLLQNYPNPFNPETTISFQLTNRGRVVLKIFNAAGQEIRNLINQELPEGLHQIIWNGRTEYGDKSASGIYFYQLRVNNQIQTNRMTLLQ